MTAKVTAKSVQSFSRKSLAWLFVVQVFIIAPHFGSAPKWILIVWLLTAFWRWKIFQGAWSYPTKIQKVFLVLIASVGLFVSFGISFSYEAMISLLLVGFVLKLLELKSTQDFVLLVFIALFILATQFIEFNHFLSALYGFGCLVLLCSALMQLHKESENTFGWQDIRPSFYILLQAIPFMLILFLVAPRLGSFWAVPSPAHAKTGMSDSMSPGDFTELMESDEMAFRVTFDGAIPSHEKLYWRSLVFSYFDGREWKPSRSQTGQKILEQDNKYIKSHIQFKGDRVHYEIIAEPTGKTWLYTLAAPQNWDGNIGFLRDMRLQAFSAVTERIHYQVTSALSYQFSELDADELAQNLQLPLNGNIKTRETAQAWMKEVGSTEKLIEKLFSLYHQRFFYTLRPAALGVDFIDDFLWKTQQGFCEHFSSSFVFFLRSAGVPARVVIGYQGGDVNSIQGYLNVRQRDAHAWAEVWIENRGWVMYDPTGAVAPERVQHGIEQSLSASDQQLLAKPFGSTIKFLLKIHEQWDAVNFQWTKWVMNYDENTQSQFLERLLGEVSPMKMAVWVMTIATLVAMFIFGGLMWRTPKQKLSETEVIYKKLCEKLLRGGFKPHAGETPRHFIARIIVARPEYTKELEAIINQFELLNYGEDERALLTLKAHVKHLKFSVPKRNPFSKTP